MIDHIRGAVSDARNDERLEDAVRHVLRHGKLGKQSERRLREALENAPSPTRGAVDPSEAVETVANAIWPLDGLSSDEARDELRRDVWRGLEAAGLLDHLRGAVDERNEYAPLTERERAMVDALAANQAALGRIAETDSEGFPLRSAVEMNAAARKALAGADQGAVSGAPDEALPDRGDDAA
jgi:hypothetical protein